MKHHPDRVAADSPERAQRTKKFQQINDAYFTLSDPTRRREYDVTQSFTGGDSAGATGSGAQSAGGFPWSAFGFGQQKPQANGERPSNDAQFGSVFEEMMSEEGRPEDQQDTTTSIGHFWSIMGLMSGATLGFIFANVPGAIGGAVAGNRFGAIRDKRGKSVYTVFQVRIDCERVPGSQCCANAPRNYHKVIRRNCCLS